MTVLLVFVGAIVGAPLRYLVDRTVQAKHDSLFPWGTLAVNVVGCLVLGVLAGLGTGLPSPLFALLGTGFCATLTTYSTFSFETMRLWEQHARFYAVANVAISLVAGVGAVLLGYTLATV